MRKSIPLIAVLASLTLPAGAGAHDRHYATHRHHGHHHHAKAQRVGHRAHRASVGCEYWPILEECLTPQEGREVERDVTEELNEVAG